MRLVACSAVPGLLCLVGWDTAVAWIALACEWFQHRERWRDGRFGPPLAAARCLSAACCALTLPFVGCGVPCQIWGACVDTGDGMPSVTNTRLALPWLRGRQKRSGYLCPPLYAVCVER